MVAASTAVWADNIKEVTMADTMAAEVEWVDQEEWVEEVITEAEWEVEWVGEEAITEAEAAAWEVVQGDPAAVGEAVDLVDGSRKTRLC